MPRYLLRSVYLRSGSFIGFIEVMLEIHDMRVTVIASNIPNKVFALCVRVSITQKGSRSPPSIFLVMVQHFTLLRHELDSEILK
jgi:hypothetical protein